MPFCERERTDAVRDVFCSDAAGQFASLSDLQAALGLPFGTAQEDASQSMFGSEVLDLRVALLYPTALSREVVSRINPRAIVLGKSAILAFHRGVQQVEIAEPGATPAQALVQACGSCRNDVLDQSLSRARFNIALTRMNRREIDIAMDRLPSGPRRARSHATTGPTPARRHGARGTHRLPRPRRSVS